MRGGEEKRVLYEEVGIRFVIRFLVEMLEVGK